MKRSTLLIAALAGLLWSVSGAAETVSDETVRATIERTLSSYEILEIAPTRSDALIAVKVRRTVRQRPETSWLYVTSDGKHLLQGDLYEFTKRSVINLTGLERASDARSALAKVPESETINFSPGRDPREVIYVFTDVDCSFCQKFHKEVPALIQAGVEVRYLAYPRNGIGSQGFQKLATAWCAPNPQNALSLMKARRAVPVKICPGNPVVEHYSLGAEIGVTGTPAIFLGDGRMVGGYRTAKQILSQIRPS